MEQLFVPQVGAVLSADIAVPRHENEMRFYSRVLTTGARQLWRDDLLNNAGLPIIGLGAQTPEFAQLPLQWMPHIQVADVSASAQRARDLGGKELMHQRSPDGTSQWAVFLDPNGAAFGLVPVVSPDQIPPVDPSIRGDATAEGTTDGEVSRAGDGKLSIGCIAWLDLTVPDAKATRDFYQQVVGWSVEDVLMQDGDGEYVDYNMVGQKQKPIAGICHSRGSNADLPPVWLIYLPVGDLAESLRRAGEEGGQVLKTVSDGEGRNVFAVVADPVGVFFALIQA